MSHPYTSYHRAVSYLVGLSNVSRQGGSLRKDSVERMRFFLKLLGNPHRGPRYIHVTGTSGKSSVAALLAQTLRAAGFRVGLYTSPFCTTAIEKIGVNGRYISPAEFSRLTERMKPAIDRAFQESPVGPPSYLDAFLGLAFLFFKQQRCQWVVIEVGAGGSHDNTNVIERPAVTMVTNIHFDHAHLFGPTLNRIAAEKSGIIKRGSHFFTAERRPTILRRFERVCRLNGATYHEPVTAPLARQNQALAGAVGQFLGLPEHVLSEPKPIRLSCRFETVQRHPLVILDGAHNESKMKYTINQLSAIRYRKLHLILGITASKDTTAIVRSVAPRATTIAATRFEITERKCSDPNELAALCRRFNKKATITIHSDPRQALAVAQKRANRNDVILVTGSFFLAGELRQHWYPEDRILRTRRSF